MALVGSFASRVEADVAAGMLRANGVDASIVADDAGGAEPQLTFVTGGVRLRVPDGSVTRAQELLADIEPRRGGGWADDTPDAPADRGSGRALRSAGRLAAAVLLGIVLHQLLEAAGITLLR